MGKINRVLLFLSHSPLIVLIFLLAVFTSLLFTFWYGYPSGYDAPGHVFKVYFMARFWPDINWLPNWTAGMPHFLRYPSLPYIFLGLISRLGYFSIPQIVAGAAVLSIGLGGVGVYLFIHQLTHSKSASLVGAFLYILSPATWFLPGRGGGYARAFSLPLMILAIWAATIVLGDMIQQKKRYWPYFLSSLFLGLSFLFHFFIGAFAFSFVCFWILGFVGVIKFKQLLRVLFKIFIPAILIAAPLWVPMIVFRDPKNSLAVDSINWPDMRAISWARLFNFYDFSQEISIHDSVKLTPFLYPLAAVLWVMSLIFKKGKLAINDFLGRAVVLLTLVSLFYLFFARTVSPLFSILYAGVVDQPFSLVFATLFVASLVGLLIFWVFPRPWLVSLFSLLTIIGITSWAVVQYQLPQRGLEGLEKGISSRQYELEYPLIQKVVDEPKNFNLRFGTSTDADLAAWFNIIYPYVPQTRDYFASGIVNIDDDVYKTHTLWEQADNYPETEFNLDWYGVNKFVVTPENKKVKGKYEAKPETFKCLVESDSHKVFEYLYSNPILFTTNAPTILIIGKEAYDFVFRSFAQGNLNSQYLIPVVGKERIDDYKLDDLKFFDMILLYNYQYKVRDTAFDLLAKYVRAGGRLFIESNVFVEGEGRLPEPLPVASVKKESFTGRWDLNLDPFFREVDLANFSPPIYQGGPWGGVVAREVKNWGKVLVSSQGEPLIVGGSLGSGRVVWSGMNLPYHVLTYHNLAEAKFLGLILAWLKGENYLPPLKIAGQAKEDLTYESQDFTAKFINPQEFRLALKVPSKGVLFKESYFPSWQATMVAKGGRTYPLKIFKVGPRMMYVRLPTETKEVIFRFNLPTVVTLAQIISWVTLIFLLIQPFLRGLPFFPVKSLLEKFKIKAGGWWEKDEE